MTIDNKDNERIALDLKKMSLLPNIQPGTYEYWQSFTPEQKAKAVECVEEYRQQIKEAEEAKRILLEKKESPINSIDYLLDKIIVKIEKFDNSELLFHTSEGRILHMHHSQQCCEDVRIEDITGDMQDLIGKPILMAEMTQCDASKADYSIDELWTFYKLATFQGYVDLRWIGEATPYYSIEIEIGETDIEYSVQRRSQGRVIIWE